MALYIVWPCGLHLGGTTSPSIHIFRAKHLALFIVKLFYYLPLKYSLHEKLMKNMGLHCTVRPRVLAMADGVILTLEPIKSLYNIYSVAGLLVDGLAQSPSEAVPLDLLWEVREYYS